MDSLEGPSRIATKPLTPTRRPDRISDVRKAIEEAGDAWTTSTIPHNDYGHFHVA